MSARSRTVQIAVLLALAQFSQMAFASEFDPQEELKAAIVLTFLRYSYWPAGRTVDDPIVVGVLGRPAFSRVLTQVLAAKTIESHPIRILALTTISDARCCDVIYFASEKSVDIKPTLQNIVAMHTLSIGESDKFLEAGGAVRLLTIDGHMSFEVNLEVVERSGVTISSKLLRYREVKGKVRP